MAVSERTVLQFAPSTSTAATITARVHPLVVFNICDCYVRRPDQAERVIGTLLGSVLPDGTVDIRNSYVVPHNEFSDQVALDIEYHHTMLKSHLKVNPEEVIVGWFSTGLGVTGGSWLIHEFYSREITNPGPANAKKVSTAVHLTVDTGFTNGEGTIKAYVSSNLSLGDQQLAAQFQEIPLDLRMVEAERVGFDILKKTSVDKLPSDLEGMEVLMERLVTLINDVYKYVDDVVEGRVAAHISPFLSVTPKVGMRSSAMASFDLKKGAALQMKKSKRRGRRRRRVKTKIVKTSPSTRRQLEQLRRIIPGCQQMDVEIFLPRIANYVFLLQAKLSLLRQLSDIYGV